MEPKEIREAMRSNDIPKIKALHAEFSHIYNRPEFKRADLFALVDGDGVEEKTFKAVADLGMIDFLAISAKTGDTALTSAALPNPHYIEYILKHAKDQLKKEGLSSGEIKERIQEFVNTPNNDGNIALHYICNDHNKNSVQTNMRELLIENGGAKGINAQNSDGKAPLHFYLDSVLEHNEKKKGALVDINREAFESVRDLMNHKKLHVNPTLQDKDGKSILDYFNQENKMELSGIYAKKEGKKALNSADFSHVQQQQQRRKENRGCSII